MIKPMLAELSPKPFNDERYLWEEKYDGIRCIAEIKGGAFRLWARSGTEKTDMFPEIDLRTKIRAVIDGELVCDTFNGMQHRANRINGIHQASINYPAHYEVFDVLELNGVSLVQIPLSERKKLLQEALTPTDNVSVADFTEDGEALFQKMLAEGKEGIIGKLKAGTYQAGKRAWLKVKCNQKGEFVICGYTPGTGWREATFGALVLGRQDIGKLTYVGAVGTGFTSAEIDRLFKLLRSSPVAVCPFSVSPPEPDIRWVRPEIVVEVKYLEFTNDGRLRFPAYIKEVRM